VQTWARAELMALSNGKLQFPDDLLGLLLRSRTMEEVTCTCAAHVHCSMEDAKKFAVKLFR